MVYNFIVYFLLKTAHYLCIIIINMKKYILLAFVILASCSIDSSNSHSTTLKIKIRPDSFHSSGELSDFASIQKIIPLETNDSCLIMEIKKAVFFDDRFFLLDERSQKVLEFDFNGNFITQIGARGEGPGQYLETHDFSICDQTGNIYISDYYKFHVYSYGGKHLETVKLNYSGYNMSVIDPDTIVFWGNSRDYRLRVSNSDGNLYEEYIPYHPKQRTGISFPLSKQSDLIDIHVPTCDTIYTVKRGNLMASAFLDFGEYAFTMNDFNKLSDTKKGKVQSYIINECDCISCYTFLKSDSAVFLHLRYSGNVYSGFYNLNTSETRFFRHDKIANDLFNSFFYFNPIGVMGNKYILQIDPHYLIHNLDSDFLSKEENRKVLSTITEYSNPVLLIVEPIFKK